MLNRCAARLISFDNTKAGQLVTTLKAAGFGQVEVVKNSADFSLENLHHKICFFVFDQDIGHENSRKILRLIRSIKKQHRCFSPAILAVNDMSVDAIKNISKSGFDDVVSLELLSGGAANRLTKQLDQSLHYFETSDYFGPDRRSGTSKARHPENPQPFNKYTIVRNVHKGINIADVFQFRPETALTN